MPKEYGEDIKVGTRVELSPSTDLWMMGAKFGTVTKLVNGVAVVKMDHPRIKRRQKYPVRYLRAL